MGARRLRRRPLGRDRRRHRLAVAGAVVMSRGPDGRSGALLCAAAAAWLIAEWDNPGTPSAILFTLGMALGMAAPALLAHALLVHGSGRLGSVAARLVVGAAYAALAVLAGIGSTLVADPGASGCSSCLANLLRVADAPDAVAWLERWGLRFGDRGAGAAALLVLWRLWRATSARGGRSPPYCYPASSSSASWSPTRFTTSAAGGSEPTNSIRRCGSRRPSRWSPSRWESGGSNRGAEDPRSARPPRRRDDRRGAAGRPA